MAYFILPHYVFQSLHKITDMCLNTPAVAGPFYYVMACQARDIEPDMETAKTFRWRHDSFDKKQQYFALEYPIPTPVNLEGADAIAMLESGSDLVLAPYFSVILCGDATQPEYFILGQAPLGGGTTVRQIQDGGANCNMGPGPEPTLECFLEAICDRQSGSER
jgi:hypothetical protein